MGDLLIRDIPEAMKRNIAARAGRAGRSLSEEAKELQGRALTSGDAGEAKDTLSAWDVLRPILADDSAEFSQIMDEIEAERKKDFGRPFEDFE